MDTRASGLRLPLETCDLTAKTVRRQGLLAYAFSLLPFHGAFNLGEKIAGLALP